MELTVTYNLEQHIVIATPIGVINKKNVLKTFVEALKLSKKESCFNLLFDIRLCPLGQSMTDGLRLMSNLTSIPGMTFRHRTAVVFNPENYPIDRATFIENVINNRANPAYRVFTTIDAATKWLVGAPTLPPTSA
ncbi:MAG: hypothetical protein K9G46_15235 [Flavobacteriales bacterium]|nr:hypothetical protein [Flavobacteriales bacterium]